jgi:hypothetical protein
VVLICNFFTKSALHYGLLGFWGLYAGILGELYRYCISANYHIGFLVNKNYFHVVLMLKHYVGPLF